MTNLTPHAIMIALPTGGNITIPPSGRVARCSAVATWAEPVMINGLEVETVTTAYGAVDWAGPAPTAESPVIVSGLVLAAVPGMDGVFAPDTGSGAIRDSEGKIVGTTRLIRA